MNWVLQTLYLPPNTQDVQVVDIDMDGQLEVIVSAKDNTTTVPAPITIFIYKKIGDEWKKNRQISLDQQAMFWQARLGLWGLDSNGVVDLLSGERMVSTQTWLHSLGITSPKRGTFVEDLDKDGVAEWMIHNSSGMDVWSKQGLLFQSRQPVDGSLREYSKTGGTQVEIAQRSRPLVVGDLDADGMDNIMWLDGDIGLIEQTDSNQQDRRPLPLNVEPQYSNRPKRELSSVQFRDLNDDQYLDVMWQNWVTGESWFGATSEMVLSLGGATSWSEPTILKRDKAVVDVQLTDWNSDGTSDLWILEADLGLASISKTLLSQSAKLELSVFPLIGTQFNTLPSAQHSISVPVDQEDAFDWIVVSDVTGDAKPELCILQGETLSLWNSDGDSWVRSLSEKLTHRGNFVQDDNSELMVIWSSSSPTATIVHLRTP